MDSKEKLTDMLGSLTKYNSIKYGKQVHEELCNIRAFAHNNEILTPSVEDEINNLGHKAIQEKIIYAHLSAEKGLPLNVGIAINDIRTIADSQKITISPTLEQEMEIIDSLSRLNAIEDRLKVATAYAKLGEKNSMYAVLNNAKQYAKALALDITSDIEQIKKMYTD